VEGNYTLTFKRNHPQDRASYGIAGNAGIVVFQRSLFAGAYAPASNDDLAGLPRVITLDSVMVSPQAKASKSEAAAEKAAAKAAKDIAKEAAKLEKAQAAQEKALAKAAKLNAQLAAAKAKVEAATATPAS
jgi:hypothetical protein